MLLRAWIGANDDAIAIRLPAKTSHCAAVSSGTNFTNWQQWASGATSSDQLVDLSNDGKADLIQFWHGYNYVALSNGSGFGAWNLWGQGGGTTSDPILDVTGEGRKDLVQIWHGNVYVAASTGTDFGNWQQWGSGATSADKRVRLR